MGCWPSNSLGSDGYKVYPDVVFILPSACRKPAFPDVTLWMWFDERVVTRGMVAFIFRYLRARVIGMREHAQPTRFESSPDVTWFITTRDMPGPLLHTLSTGLAKTRYPNLRIVVLDCGVHQPAQGVVNRLDDHRVSITKAQKTQPEWYQWICSNANTDLFVVTHDDLHFVVDGWLEGIIQPMILDERVGCVCGEDFPVRLNTVEPSGEHVDITFGLSTWMWAARRAATAGQPCDFSFAKRGFGPDGLLEVWDQGGLWLEQLKENGWKIVVQSQRNASKWQHFENFDWTRDAGDPSYARLKRNQRWMVSQLAELHLAVLKLQRRG